jgi:hypothetical protein
MRQRGRIGALVAGLVAALTLSTAATSAAHVREAAGPYTVELGWAEEPTYNGARNAIEVKVEGAAGKAVADPRASLRVEVSFGEAVRQLALAPEGGRGRFAAAIIPTRPGVYAFHVTGTVRGRAIDVAATCSERTFDCVESATEIEFPVVEPSGAELGAKLGRAQVRIRHADERAASAQTVAAVAVVLAVLALLATLLLARRHNRQD